MSDNPHTSSADTREIIARSHPTDYDGHTEFGRMTPAERLAWLDAAVVLIETSRQSAGRAWAVAEDPAGPPAQS